MSHMTSAARVHYCLDTSSNAELYDPFGKGMQCLLTSVLVCCANYGSDCDNACMHLCNVSRVYVRVNVRLIIIMHFYVSE